MFKRLTQYLAVPNLNFDSVGVSNRTGPAEPRRALSSISPRETGEPRRAFTAIPARATGRVGSDADYPKNVAAPDVKVRQSNQIPFNFCPEDFRRPPKNCDNCGGDNYHHGICNDILLSGRQTYDCLLTGYGCSGYYCQCTHEGEDHNPRVTSTTVVDGQTGTVIYEPMALTQYSNLRYHTTVTLTEVATTTTDGGTGLETALAVVFAGGIAWVAISEAGGAAAIAAIRPPGRKPEDAKEDDRSCKRNPEEECPNCGGSDGYGLCSSGDQAGCPCDEKQNCPNEPPRCSDQQCGGDNGESQCSASGEINGCTCCPDKAPLCTDNTCKGNSIQSCTGPKWEECGCLVYVDSGETVSGDEPDFGNQNPVYASSSVSSVAGYVFTAVWDANYTNLPGYPTLLPGVGTNILRYKETKPGEPVKKGTKLRILPVGDSITAGDEVVFAGTESSGTMKNGNYVSPPLSDDMPKKKANGNRKAAWSGKTIQYISDHVDPSLKQRPNIILLAAGTNDMNPNHAISTEGNDPRGAADRLGKLIDKMVDACPDAVVVVAMIIDTCNQDQSPRTRQFQQLVPGVVRSRREDGKHVLAADFTTFQTSNLQDCIHPTNDGYKLMGDYWNSFVHQIPRSWIEPPVGPDPVGDDDGDGENGGIDKGIPPPDWGTSPVQVTSKQEVADAAEFARGGKDKPAKCNGPPHWRASGKIGLGLERNGDWQYHKDWVAKGEIASGLGWEEKYVRLHDMNGDGKADYVWIHPETGEIRCWLNNMPEPWSPAGTNNSIIGSGVLPAKFIYMADMNGDGMDDYLVVNPNNGAVRVWWNYGPDKNWVNGWKFVEGGEIASGVPHANLQTLRFPDINGDGRADYVYIGEHGALKHHLNTGSPGGQDVLFHAMGGIATGAVEDISRLVFADMNGDGRDDYLIWDDDGGLTGFLNQPTNREGVPLYINQGPAKTIADGINKPPSTIRLADMDGDGKDDYVHVGDNGAISVWYNRGTTADHLTIDEIRFADIDGDGVDDWVLLDPESGAPTVYLNTGINDQDSLGWLWNPAERGKPIATGAAPASQVVFGDIDGDGMDDYLVLDPKTGALKAYLNTGPDPTPGATDTWPWKPIGTIATGLGPGHRVRIADIDGDGRDDYIFLKPNGGTTIYRNVYSPTNDGPKYRALPAADASGIGQSPEEIQFVDINGDGKADYVWTSRLDGRARVWYNEYPALPAWREGGEIAGGVGTSGANVRYAQLQRTGRADYVALEPKTGAFAGWLGGCGDYDDAPKTHRVSIANGALGEAGKDYRRAWLVKEHPLGGEEPKDLCGFEGSQDNTNPSIVGPDYPVAIWEIPKLFGHECFYVGGLRRIGQLVCDGVSGIQCYKHPNAGIGTVCKNKAASYTRLIVCEWD
ncbi:carbohydrate esterase family 3 protein [Apiospora aurea]|uniref:Carbohydrate esterase family 3 protein n=1 Tax=Apiospora aurea TaxID=335848 RepID=A0ABR1QGH5_9PEZI